MDDPTAVPSERRIDVTPDGPYEVHGSPSLRDVKIVETEWAAGRSTWRSGFVTDRRTAERYVAGTRPRSRRTPTGTTWQYGSCPVFA